MELGEEAWRFAEVLPRECEGRVVFEAGRECAARGRSLANPRNDATTLVDDMPDVPELVRNGPEAGPTLVLAHGAGAPMDSPFMETIATGVAQHGIGVVRFEFPYMARRRREGSRRPPDRVPVLLSCWREVVAAVGSPETTLIGGKSMGGRAASMICDESGVAGLVCLGYPFHPPGKPTSPTRIAHLADLRTPALFVQGERDRLGSREEVAEYPMASGIEVVWMPDGDHSLVPRVRSGHTEEQHLRDACDHIARFVQSAVRDPM